MKLFIGLLLLFLPTATDSGSSTIQDSLKCNDDISRVEISDKNNSIVLGFDENHIYMIINEEIKNSVNSSMVEVFKHENELFYDSQGLFLPGEPPFLTSTKIDIPSDEVELKFEHGDIEFLYAKQVDIRFEDIIFPNGSSVLRNFYIEDLEQFVLKYRSACF